MVSRRVPLANYEREVILFSSSSSSSSTTTTSFWFSVNMWVYDFHKWTSSMAMQHPWLITLGSLLHSMVSPVYHFLVLVYRALTAKVTEPWTLPFVVVVALPRWSPFLYTSVSVYDSFGQFAFMMPFGQDVPMDFNFDEDDGLFEQCYFQGCIEQDVYQSLDRGTLVEESDDVLVLSKNHSFYKVRVLHKVVNEVVEDEVVQDEVVQDEVVEEDEVVHEDEVVEEQEENQEQEDKDDETGIEEAKPNPKGKAKVELKQENEAIVPRPSSVRFLAIQYVHPTLPKPVLLDLPIGYYQVGNELFSAAFIEWLLQQQSFWWCRGHVVSPGYDLLLMDDQLAYTVLRFGQYVRLSATGYETKGNAIPVV